MKIALVCMAAGSSSRFGGRPKQFAIVGPKGETLIEYSMNQALKAGFDKIIFIVSEKTNDGLKKIFGQNYKGTQIFYVFQKFDEKIRDKPWGTTDALCSAKSLIDCPFIVCNTDDVYGEEAFTLLRDHLNDKKSEATISYDLLRTLPPTGEVNRGIFKLNTDRTVSSITENFGVSRANIESRGLRPDSQTNVNLFALHPETIELLSQILQNFKKEHIEDRKIECLLPTDLSSLIKSGRIKMHCYKTKEKWSGVTYPEDEKIVREDIRNFTSI